MQMKNLIPRAKIAIKRFFKWFIALSPTPVKLQLLRALLFLLYVFSEDDTMSSRDSDEALDMTYAVMYTYDSNVDIYFGHLDVIG